MPRKYLYGEFRWNVAFSRGMARIRKEGIRTFRIDTEVARHVFKRIGDFVERKSVYFGSGSYGTRTAQYVYYNLKGRRICPEHLVALAKGDWMDRRCPTEGCKYEPEGYTISTGYEDKLSKAVYEKAGWEVMV